MGKLLDDYIKDSTPEGIVVPWPIVGPIRMPKKVIERNRRVLTTEGEAKETLTDLLRYLGYGQMAQQVNHPKEEVIVAQDIAKGILAMCGVVMTLDGIVEIDLKEE